jgi:inner membrane transporter RhtA
MTDSPTARRLRSGNAAAWGCGAASAIAYGLTPTFAALGYAGGVSPAVLVCLRSLVGAAFLLLLAWTTGRLKAVSWKSAVGLCCVCGPLFGIQLLCFFAAVQVTGAQIAVVVVHVYPLFVMALIWALTRQPIRRGQLVLALIMSGGIALVAGAGTAGYALYLVVGERWVHQVSAVAAGGFASLGAGLTTGLIAVADGQPWTFAPSGWASILFQGLLLMPIGIGCSFIAVRALGSASVSLLGLLEPVVGVLAAQALLGEQLSPPQWAGMTVVLLASAALPWVREVTASKVPHMPSTHHEASLDIDTASPAHHRQSASQDEFDPLIPGATPGGDGNRPMS